MRRATGESGLEGEEAGDEAGEEAAHEALTAMLAGQVTACGGWGPGGLPDAALHPPLASQTAAPWLC